MKTYLIIYLTLLMLFIGSSIMAEPASIKSPDKKKPKKEAICPITRMGDSCLSCHVRGNFRVRETAPDASLDYPVSSMKVLDCGKPDTKGYYLLTDVNDAAMYLFFRYLDEHGIIHAIIEIHSPGGSLMGAQRIIGLIESWKRKGGIVETHLYGIAASAGFQIFVAGTPGRRLACPSALLMWHELLSFEMFGKVSTPSDKEEEARVLRFLQDTRNEWLAQHCKLTKKELDEKIRKREFWMTGEQAIEYGFADGRL